MMPMGIVRLGFLVMGTTPTGPMVVPWQAQPMMAMALRMPAKPLWQKPPSYKQHQCTHQKDGCNVLEQCDHTVSLDSQQEKERQQNRTAELSVFC